MLRGMNFRLAISTLVEGGRKAFVTQSSALEILQCNLSCNLECGV